MTHRVMTHMMFTGNAAAALELYAATFPQFTVTHLERSGDTVKRADASFGGHALVVIDSPPVHAFTFTPSMSLFVECETVEELDAAFAALSSGGQVLMALDNYGFSRRFGWCTDRFGVSWQLNLV
jgi:predicted 3-demethylubiquinone-9 3-methyltransferase (glyoxalase superfamily)